MKYILTVITNQRHNCLMRLSEKEMKFELKALVWNEELLSSKRMVRYTDEIASQNINWFYIHLVQNVIPEVLSIFVSDIKRLLLFPTMNIFSAQQFYWKNYGISTSWQSQEDAKLPEAQFITNQSFTFIYICSQETTIHLLSKITNYAN